MNKCKLDRPEKPEFFRVFPMHLLMDEEYEFLSREEWGSVFLLMMGQWTHEGSLPDDPEKLALIARCTAPELQSLMEKWRKLKPVEGKAGRLAIPFLLNDWEEVMAYYREQSRRGKASAEARRTKYGTAIPIWATNDPNRGSADGSNQGRTDQDKDKDQDSSSSMEEVLPLEEESSRMHKVVIPVEEVKKAARMINASLRRVGGSPAKQLEPPQVELMASYLQDPCWVKELRMALKYVEGNPWFTENPGKFTFDLMLRPGKVSEYSARLSPPASSPPSGLTTRQSGGSAPSTPLTEAEVQLMLGDHYGTYTALLEIFPSGKIVPTRDIPTILHILKETSATSLIQAAKIHRAQCMDGEKGSTRFMKPFDKWAELGLHLLANDSRAERTPRPALRQNITGGHDLAAMAMGRATHDFATNLGVDGIPEAPDV